MEVECVILGNFDNLLQDVFKICTLLTLFITFTLVTWKEGGMGSSREKLMIVTVGSKI